MNIENEIKEIAAEIVNAQVLVNVGGVISELNPTGTLDDFLMTIDVPTTLEVSEYEIQERDGSEYVLIDTSNDNEVIEIFDSESEAMEYFSDNIFSLVDEPETVEILEFWAVDNDLADKLEEKGKPVLREYGLNIWGRECSGQAIKHDGVILSIANDIYDFRKERGVVS